MIDDDSLKNLEKLHQLKTDGVITEADFEAAKQKLLEGQKRSPQAAVASTVGGNALAEDDWLGWALLPLRKYADFKGRSRRKEFWMFGLFSCAVIFSCLVIIATDEYGSLGKLGEALIAIFLIGTFIPSIAVMARRYHDQDKSGWFVLLNIIPYIGMVIALLTMLFDGTPGDNRFGPSPKST